MRRMVGLLWRSEKGMGMLDDVGLITFLSKTPLIGLVMARMRWRAAISGSYDEST